MKGESKTFSHIPVLLDKFLEISSPIDGIWVDCTFGAGNFTRGLIEKGAKKVICIDRDPEIIKNANTLKKKFGNRIHFFNEKFSKIQKITDDLSINQVDGVVLDIGMSSIQLENPNRGFSYRHNGPLDMRMSKNGFSAYDIVNKAKLKSLEDIIFFYGEERNAKRISKNIVKDRDKYRINTTEDLRKIIEKSFQGIKKQTKKSFYTKTFQALRIAVNDELSELIHVLYSIEKILKCGGKFCVISFHSLEDRIVKNFISKRSKIRQTNRYLPELEKVLPSFESLTQKVIIPSQDEIDSNPKSSSAKMRIAKKILNKKDYEKNLDLHKISQIKLEWIDTK